MRSEDEIEQELDHITKLIELRHYLPFALDSAKTSHMTGSIQKMPLEEQPDPEYHQESPKEVNAYNRGLVYGKYEALLWTLHKIREI